MTELPTLKEKFKVIGDVGGTGLFIGIDLVKYQETREPAPEQAKEIINKMKKNGILISTDEPFNNVLKIKPPMLFSRENVKLLIHSLDKIITTL